MSTTEIITRNVEYQIEFIVKIDSSTVKDLTGFTPLIQIRPYIDSDTVYASYTIGSPYITFTPASGYVKLLLPPSVTGAFTFKKGIMDLLVVNGSDTDGDRSAPIDVVVNHGVSRPA